MPRRCNEGLSDDDPPKKKNCNNHVMSSIELKHGEFLKDIAGKQWKLGKAVGVGGFGEIYLASDSLTKEVKTDCKYVAKVEDHKNGPLFVEMNCYLRIAKPEMIEAWKYEKKLTTLGMPHYVASGSHIHKGEKYRFLILPKFDKDLEKVLQEKKMLNLKTVLTISLQIMDVLEYIHSKGYIHSDVKASNILLSNGDRNKNRVKSQDSEPVSVKYPFHNPTRTCRLQKLTTTKESITKTPPRIYKTPRNLRPRSQITYLDDIPNFEKIMAAADEVDEGFSKAESSEDQVYLLDYGLASKYLTSDGKHKPFCADERKAHAGTILFCSRDAHKGVQSRRSDLESLGYNILHWLTGNLPWCDYVDDPELVAKKKLKAMLNIDAFLKSCSAGYPKFLGEYFKYLQNLQFQEKPDYVYCKMLFRQSIKANGYKNDMSFDFDNLQSAKIKPVKKRVSENVKAHKFIHKISRPPLQSNIPVKPLLRKKLKTNKVQRRTKWFEDLTDPEIILKQARKNTENQDSNCVTNIAALDIMILNPTYAMLNVYNKCMERVEMLPTYKGDSVFENASGYTYAMLAILQKIKKRKELERQEAAVNLIETKHAGTVRKCISKRKKKFESPAKPTHVHTTKSATVTKKCHLNGRRGKNVAFKRSYSLRG